MRKILYFSGTRADFGLMRKSLLAIDADPALELSVIATGMHLDPSYGSTWKEISDSGLHLAAQCPVEISPPSGKTMARAIGQMIKDFTDQIEQLCPDVVLVLGDRGEMLAAAIAAIHLNVPVAHIHGGERSGTVDESVRHAITKLSHIHFAATDGARDRLIALGERPDCVYVTGAPGLDGLLEASRRPRNEIIAELGFKLTRPVALILFHPVLQEIPTMAAKTHAVLDGVTGAGWQSIALMPNSDAGSDEIRIVFENHESRDLQTIVHLPRPRFLEIMAAADALVGNSSAGIIEAASFGTPVLNLGTRQNLRERNANVIDLPEDAKQITAALQKITLNSRFAPANIFGDGQASARICSYLKSHPLNADLMNKVLIY
ncbi:MAG: UDP-N-acetylglucosamine 2-epimerase [Hyphomicrobiales bacterium]|uniref:UDP-N-acetylglucosamine 2-epimerase n=1 Tax=Roseibium polysiphoniae TaxID=2571221 RepID=UPI00329A1DA7